MNTPPWAPDYLVESKLAESLIEQQFGLVVKSLVSLDHGWDNYAFLINEEYIFRFPRRQIAVGLMEQEIKILPKIADKLPLPIPCPSFIGKPSDIFPRPFHGYRYILGQTACRLNLDRHKREALAVDLAHFLKALHSLKITPAFKQLLPLGSNRVRGSLKECLSKLKTRLNEICATNITIIDSKLLDFLYKVEGNLPEEKGTALVHGDLYARHLLIDGNQLSGIIDWGDMHIGDPAVDLAIVHSFLPPTSHKIFCDSYGVIDEARWLKAKIWAIYSALTLCWYGHHGKIQELFVAGQIGLDFITEGIA